MKTPSQILDDVRRLLSRTWHYEIIAGQSSWPRNFSLGSVAKSDLEADFAEYQRQALQWRDWAASKRIDLIDAGRRVRGTTQLMPTHVMILDLDSAAALLGPEWKARIRRGRERRIVLAARFPDLADPASLLRAADGLGDTDFELLCAAADWFKGHPASSLTPRQVPIEGLHAKWLNTHGPLLRALVNTDDLGLLPAHPARLHFTYLDPVHLASGGRRHDCATVGDRLDLAYPPRVVIISENKDTAVHFPPVSQGISVEGSGYGGRTTASFPWVKMCPNLFYWGDMDAAGFEIVNGFRAAGLPVRTVLMNMTTYTAYERFGAATDAKGEPLRATPPKQLPHLTQDERALYDQLTAPESTRVRRIEQERIPLHIAQQAVLRHITA